MARTHEKVSALTEVHPCLSAGGASDLVQRAVVAIEGRWKLSILFRLFGRPVLRFSELERDIPGVSQKMLAQHLRELERDGLIHRTVYPEIPPKVDYRLTEGGRGLYDAFAALRTFSKTHLQSGHPGDGDGGKAI